MSAPYAAITPDVRLGVEVDGDGLAAEVRQLDGPTVLVGQLEIGGGLTRFSHGSILASAGSYPAIGAANVNLSRAHRARENALELSAARVLEGSVRRRGSQRSRRESRRSFSTRPSVWQSGQ
jgi:hypothetical protein